jgi:DnaJ-class molecular chaperone
MNYYEILEVLPNAPREEIKRAYRRLARLYHPDGSNIKTSDKSFVDIQQAYETLADPEKRLRYDKRYGFENWAKDRLRAYQQVQQQAERMKKTAQAKAAQQETRQQQSPPKKTTGQKVRAGKKPPHAAREKPRETLKTRLEKVKKTLEEDLKALGLKARHTLGSKEDTDKLKTIVVTIDALESLQGTSREISVGSTGKPRVVRVKIPGGIMPGAILRIACPKTGAYQEGQIEIRVEITPHDVVERDGPHIIVKMPLTISEAMGGTELVVPTIEEPVSVKIPPAWTCEKQIRIKGRGAQSSLEAKRGDLYLKTYVLPPATVNDSALSAAKAIDACYSADVRANIPRSLTRGQG